MPARSFRAHTVEILPSLRERYGDLIGPQIVGVRVEYRDERFRLCVDERDSLHPSQPEAYTTEADISDTVDAMLADDATVFDVASLVVETLNVDFLTENTSVFVCDFFGKPTTIEVPDFSLEPEEADLAGIELMVEEVVDPENPWFQGLSPPGVSAWGTIKCRRDEDGSWRVFFVCEWDRHYFPTDILEEECGIVDPQVFSDAFLRCGVDFGTHPDLSALEEHLPEIAELDAPFGASLAKLLRDDPQTPAAAPAAERESRPGIEVNVTHLLEGLDYLKAKRRSGDVKLSLEDGFLVMRYGRAAAKARASGTWPGTCSCSIRDLYRVCQFLGRTEAQEVSIEECALRFGSLRVCGKTGAWRR